MNHHVADEQIAIEPAEIAPMLLAWLEQSGAIVRLDGEQRLRANLDGLPDMDQTRAGTRTADSQRARRAARVGDRPRWRDDSLRRVSVASSGNGAGNRAEAARNLQ